MDDGSRWVYVVNNAIFLQELAQGCTHGGKTILVKTILVKVFMKLFPVTILSRSSYSGWMGQFRLKLGQFRLKLGHSIDFWKFNSTTFLRLSLGRPKPGSAELRCDSPWRRCDRWPSGTRGPPLPSEILSQSSQARDPTPANTPESRCKFNSKHANGAGHTSTANNGLCTSFLLFLLLQTTVKLICFKLQCSWSASKYSVAGLHTKGQALIIINSKSTSSKINQGYGRLLPNSPLW